ncbi:MAG: class I SAM-dependent methyltransferase [Myxococcota bacterium]|nr:class I SAM-dependent methyltransferase [Myxococcota bacterium]
MSDSDFPEADAHYRDAAYYDHAYSRYKPDVAFYVELAAGSGGPVLELGVGTGRVALAVAKAGIELVGVDKMTSMLERAQRRLDRAPRRLRERVSLVEGDLRDVRLERRFPFVAAPFNVFQHLYTRRDVERALATCAAHLTPNGRLAFDVLMPDPISLARDPHRYYKSRPVRHPRDGQRYAYDEAFDYDAERQVQTTTMRFSDLETGEPRFSEKLPQRQFFPQELEALLHYNGFEVLRLDGGFEGEPIDAYCESQVVIARLRR